MCIAPRGCNDYLEPAGHDVNHGCDHFLISSLSLLQKSLLELAQSLQLPSTPSYGSSYMVPYMLWWIEVRAVCWPFYNTDSNFIKMFTYHDCWVCSAIMVHKYDFRTNKAGKNHNMLLYNLYHVSYGSQSTYF